MFWRREDDSRILGAPPPAPFSPLPQRKVDWLMWPARGLPAIVPSLVSPSPSFPQPPLSSGCDPSHSPEVASRPGGERKAVSSSQQGEDLRGVQGQPAPSICLRWGYEAAGIGPSRVSLSPGQEWEGGLQMLLPTPQKTATGSPLEDIYLRLEGAPAKVNQLFLEAGLTYPKVGGGVESLDGRKSGPAVLGKREGARGACYRCIL